MCYYYSIVLLFSFVLGRLSPDQNGIINTNADVGFFCSANYTPVFLSTYTFPNTTIEAEAASICGDNLQCTFDIAATLLTSFGQATKNSIDEFDQEREIIGIDIMLLYILWKGGI